MGDLRHLLSPNPPARLDKHTEILRQLWPEGDKAAFYRNILIPNIPGQRIYKSVDQTNIGDLDSWPRIRSIPIMKRFTDRLQSVDEEVVHQKNN